MAECGAVAVEDPCALAPDARFRKLQQDSPVPVLVDFGCASPRDANLFLEQQARALSVKPGRFGISQARAMQTLAHERDAALVVGLMGESALGTLCGLQFAAALPEPLLPAELTWFLAMTEQITRVTPTIVDGGVDMPECVSLAPLIDWDAVQVLGREQSFTKDTRTLGNARMMS
jgi:L-Ala-D/L-Glu epimerase